MTKEMNPPRSRLRRLMPRAVSAAAALVAFGLAAGPSQAGFLEKFWGAKTPNTPENLNTDTNAFVAGYCPQVKIRSGTQAMVVHEPKSDTSPESVRYQASVTETARECRFDGGQVSLRVGVAGRVVAGPKGGAGKIAVPVRVAVVGRGGSVLVSQLYKTEVVLSQPAFASDFTLVVDLPAAAPAGDRAVDVFVGIDEKPGTPPKKR